MKNFTCYAGLLLIFFLLFNTPATIAQVPGQWDKTFGGNSDEVLNHTIATSDGGYLLAGTSASDVSGEKSGENKGDDDYWIVKTDAQGNKLWDKTFGGSAADVLSSVVNAPDGGYLLGGSSMSEASGNKSEGSIGYDDYWVIKTDAQGNKLWDKTFGGDDTDELRSIVVVPDGGYLLAGTSRSDASGNKSEDVIGGDDFWIIRIDEQGNQLWDKTLGDDFFNQLATAILTADGGYLLAGNNGYDYAKSDYLVIKTDAQGNKQWDKTFGGDDFDLLTAAIATPDGGYLLGGSSTSDASGDKSEDSKSIPVYTWDVFSTDYWVIRIDAQGNKLWDRTFGNKGTDRLSDIAATPDGGYLLAGSNSSSEYWVVHIDQEGNKLSDITFGGDANDSPGNVLVTEDGGYLLAGTSNSGASGDKSESSRGGTDYWIVKWFISVSGFSLIDASTKQEVLVLEDQAKINLAVLGNSRFNFQANTFPYKLGSVHFVLEGPIQFDHTENYYPYAIFGDNPRFDYKGKKLLPGEYTLSATPYEEAQMQGKAGEPQTIHFTVEDKLFIEELVLYDASYLYGDLTYFSKDEEYNLTEYKSMNLTFLAKTYPREVGKVKFELQGPISHVQEEEEFPYALFGFDEDLLEWSGREFLPGEYTLKVTPYGKDDYAGEPFMMTFMIAPDAEINGFSLINATQDTEVGELKDGDVIDLADFGSDRLNIKANTTPQKVERVRFVLEGPIDFTHTENYFPYAVFGDKPRADYIEKKLLPGEYTLRATPYAYHEYGETSTISFSVVDHTNSRRAANLQVEAFPVPTSGIVNITYEGVVEDARLKLLDLSGQVLFTRSLDGHHAEQLDLSDYKKGLYYLEVVNKESVQIKRIILE